MILTGGFDDFDVLTGGFDGFDVLTAGFDVFDDFDRGFWWFWCFDSRFWCFWWFWQEVFVFEGCIINDSRFWWFWQVVLMVLMFWQQVLMFLTGGFCFWRLYFKSCYHDSRFCPLKTLLSGNSLPPQFPIAAYLGLCCEKLWSASSRNRRASPVF